MKLIAGSARLLAPCLMLSALVACGQTQLTPGGSSGGAAVSGRAHHADTTINTNIILFDDWATAINLVEVTSNGCPWTLASGPPSMIPPAGYTSPISLTYDESCTPSHPEPVWNVSYGTNTTVSATVCTWHVTYHSASGGYFTYSVTNGSDTSCSVYDTSLGWVFQYVGGALHKRSHGDASLSSALST
jgi:hypothetical protein